MKKLDKLILVAFFGPFLLTFAVVEFILLTQYMLKYMDEFVGKDLGIAIFAELLFYFSLNMAPVALPLAVLLSSLMTFGTLGEHHELTAIKSSGIALPRILLPIFVVVGMITVGAFFFNNHIVPRANLKAYSLLWDIRQKKPSLDFKEGAFYNGLPGYSIKINKKYDDGEGLGDLMIYDHTSGRGNTSVTLADSGRMYMAYNDRYMVMELFRGISYNEQQGQGASGGQSFVRSSFDKSKFVFSMASFNLDRTKEELFSQNKMMKRIDELQYVTDSLRRQYLSDQANMANNASPYYLYFKPDTTRTEIPKTPERLRIEKARALAQQNSTALPDSAGATITKAAYTGFDPDSVKLGALKQATNKARGLRSFAMSYAERLKTTFREANTYEIEIHRKYTQSLACLIMFLIGAPLGAIIKKGGLGVPVIISIVFFILFYVLSLIGEKWGREGIVLVWNGMWMANAVLLPIGIFFLIQARTDSNLLEVNFWRKIGARFRRSKI